MNLVHSKYAAILLALMFIFQATTASAEDKKEKTAGCEPDKVLVKFYSEITKETKDSIRKRFSAEVVKQLDEFDAEVWKLHKGAVAGEVIKELKKESAVESSGSYSTYNPGSASHNAGVKQRQLNSSDRKQNTYQNE